MKRVAIAFLAICLSTTLSANDNLARIRESFCRVASMDYARDAEQRRLYIEASDYGRAAIDVLLMQLYLSVQLPDEEVARVLELSRPDGSYSDIDYADKQRGGWQATLHVTRLYALARAYVYPSSSYYHSPELSAFLHRSLDWWTERKLKNPNWWHNEIGVPKKLASAMLLIRDELSKAEIDKAFGVLGRTRFGRTGQNKVSQAGVQLMKGLLIDDESLVVEARKQILEEVKITKEEGIQPDWSYHQHGPQMQMGNYGLCFASDVSFWAEMLKDTDYAFPEEKYAIVEKLVSDGLSWTIWKDLMDPSACGRQLHIGGLKGKALIYATAAANMHVSHNEPLGAKYFHRSDYGVYRTDKWFSSIRMQSGRTIGFEYTNNENLLANFSSDGVLLLMQSGQEYTDIFPYWDWRKLPGVTSYEDGKPIKRAKTKEGTRNHSNDVSGWVDANTMTTTMQVNRDSLHAFKTNFFFPDMIVALGCDIRTNNPEVTRITTTMDQNHLVGKPVRGRNWVCHNNRGYISLDGSEIKMETGLQSGSWENMAPSYAGVEASGKVFKVYFEHDPASVGSYAYALKPCAGASATRRAARHAPVVLRNDSHLQAVKYKGIILAVSHFGGFFDIDGHNVSIPKNGMVKIVDGKVSGVFTDNNPEIVVSASNTCDCTTIPSSHPRLFNNAGFRADASAKASAVNGMILSNADQFAGLDTLARVLNGKRMLSVSREALQRLVYLSYAYRITGEPRFSEAARKLLLNVCSFQDWNPSHYLDVAEMATAVSIAYDWNYGQLSDADRKHISAAVKRNVLDSASGKEAWFYSRTNNWNQVCNAGLIISSLAFYEDYPELCRQLIEKSLASNRLSMDCYAPDGGFPEGFGYWSYGTSYEILLIEALRSCFGDDFGLSSSPGFRQTGVFKTFMRTPGNRCFNYSDSGPFAGISPEVLWFAKETSDLSLASLESRWCHTYQAAQSTSCRLLPIFFYLTEEVYRDDQIQPSANTFACRGEVPVYIYRSGWNSVNDTYLAVKGGSASSAHAHMDAGSFVFEDNGGRWSVDLGMQDYTALEKAGLAIWDLSQHSDRWKVYRNNNFSHSTISVSDSLHNMFGYAPLEELQGRHGARVDLTDVLANPAIKSSAREIWVDDESVLRIEDCFSTGNSPVDIVWTLTMVGKATVAEDNSVVLHSQGKTKQLTFAVDNASISRLESCADDGLNLNGYDAPNPGTSRVTLAVHIEKNTEAVLSSIMK